MLSEPRQWVRCSGAAMLAGSNQVHSRPCFSCSLLQLDLIICNWCNCSFIPKRLKQACSCEAYKGLIQDMDRLRRQGQQKVFLATHVLLPGRLFPTYIGFVLYGLTRQRMAIAHAAFLCSWFAWMPWRGAHYTGDHFLERRFVNGRYHGCQGGMQAYLLG